MSIRSRGGGNLGQPGENQVYRQSFIAHVHQLLAAGYSRLDRSALRDQEEPAITGFLVREIRRYLEGPMAPPWAQAFTVHDDPPVEFPGTAGRSRPRVDIELERVQPGPRPRFQFEAKRLCRKGSIGEYFGKDGLQNFLSGRYAGEHEDAGMLGYVQVQPVQDWVEKVRLRMEETPEELLIDAGGEAWRSRADPQLMHSYSSFHRRPWKLLRVHHTFLECC